MTTLIIEYREFGVITARFDWEEMDKSLFEKLIQILRDDNMDEFSEWIWRIR